MKVRLKMQKPKKEINWHKLMDNEIREQFNPKLTDILRNCVDIGL